MVLFFCPLFPQKSPAESGTKSQVSPASPQAYRSFHLLPETAEVLEVQRLGEDRKALCPEFKRSQPTNQHQHLAAAEKTTTYNYGR